MKILLISYDNDSHVPFFPVNLFYLLGHLNKAGHDVGVFNQDIHHNPDEDLTKILDENPWDIVGIGAVAGYYQYRKLKSLSRAIAKSKNRARFQYVLGGHGPAAEPEFFLNEMAADSVVVGDGEYGFDEIINNGASGVVNAKPCTSEPNLAMYGQFPWHVYRLIRWPTSTRSDFCWPILTSRGCKYACSFCYRMREGYWQRPVDAILDEIRWLQEHFGITHFQFADELLMASEKRTAHVCQAILNADLKIKWDCNGRLNHAKPDLLKLMREAGCEYINYGIESLDQGLLNQMHKGLTVDRIHQGVEDTLAAGCSPGLNFIWGFPGDTVENLEAATQFLLKYDPCDELRTIRPVTPYPGTELYRLAIEQGLLDGPKDFYGLKHINSDLFTVNFMDIDDDVAHLALFEANIRLADNYNKKRFKQVHDNAWKFYRGESADFRGWRAV
jgi:radical SAM superfamily enzyme YgiQ (UPF0313 family)